MNRALFYPLLLACGLSLSACDTASANSPEFSLEVEYTAIAATSDSRHLAQRSSHYSEGAD
ncbi:hypothetical protein ACTG10_01505 [Aeromonas hydrophila]|uniref:hypothetical protein n=1 Tax=Aeromonas hydrophila TaxID=644 RepID=UPI003F7A3A6E